MSKIFSALLLTAFTFLSVNAAQAAVEVKACAKYQKADQSWSPAYRVKGFVISGKELNEQTKTAYYQESRHYYLILWRSGDYTIFALNEKQTRLSDEHRAYRDEDDRLWHAHAGWNPCN